MQGLKNSWNIFLDIPQTSDEDAVEAGPARQSFSSQGYDQYCNEQFLKILWFDQLDKYWTIEHDVIHALDFKLRHKISGQIQTSEVNTMHRDAMSDKRQINKIMPHFIRLHRTWCIVLKPGP